MKIRFIDAGLVSALRSQTIYHALAYARTPDTPDTVVFSIPAEPYVCTGYHRSPAVEINLDYCLSNQLPLIRRETGGGTVYIDPGQVFVQWIFGTESLPRMVEQRFRLFCQPLIETYQFFGINAFFFPPNDVHVGQRKIVGTGAGSIGNAEVVTGNFILDFDPERMAALLNVPEGPFRRLTQEGIRKYMSSFRRETKDIPGLEALKSAYRESCEAVLGKTLEAGEFTDTEHAWMDRLDREFADPAWLAGADNGANRLQRVKVHANVWVSQAAIALAGGGTWQIALRTKGNRIDDIAFSGDAGIRPAARQTGLAKALCQVELNPEALEEILDAFLALHQASLDGLSTADLIRAIMACKG